MRLRGQELGPLVHIPYMDPGTGVVLYCFLRTEQEGSAFCVDTIHSCCEGFQDIFWQRVLEKIKP